MRVEIRVDESEEGIRLLILTDKLTNEALSLQRELSKQFQKTLNGYRREEVALLHEDELLRVYAEDKKVYCETTSQGTFRLKMRLFEAEECLDSKRFVRISGSELVNASKIKKLGISLNGTIEVTLEGGVKTYTSRRYVRQIKEFFGIG